MPLPAHDVRSESDEDLLVYMSWNDQPDVAKAACNEFYSRHVKYLYAVIHRAYGEVLGSGGVEDMVTETILRVIERSGTYEPCGSSDQDVQRRNALAWLGAVARNVCRDHFRKPDTRLILIDDESEVAARRHQPHTAQPTLPSDDLTSVHEAMGQLSEREQTVLRITMEYWDLGKEHQRLPNDVAEELARSFDTSSENIRKLRERALHKVREYVEAARLRRAGEQR